MIFTDRVEAGRLLADELQRFKDEDTVVLALLRGGLPVAYEVALALDAPLDIVFVRKIGAPGNHEFAVGAVVDGPSPEIVVNDRIARRYGISKRYIETTAERELAKIVHQRLNYLKNGDRINIKGKTVIIVDDGIATGATMRAAVHAVRRQNPKNLVVAAPVAAADAVAQLRTEADEVVCLTIPESFGAVGYFYAAFPQVDDEEVIDLLHRAAARNVV